MFANLLQIYEMTANRTRDSCASGRTTEGGPLAEAKVLVKANEGVSPLANAKILAKYKGL